MQKKLIFFSGLLASLMTFTQAHAEDSTDKLAISSSDGNFKLGFGGLLQESNVFTYTPNATEKNKWDMEIKAARFSIHGHAFHPGLSYFAQVQLEKAGDKDETPSGSLVHLHDAYVNSAHSPYFHIRVGKFPTPFSRQHLTSTAHMQFFAANSANDRFKLSDSSRDVGLMLHNGFSGDVEYALAVVSKGLVARLGYNYGEVNGYEATDFAGGGLRFGVAASGYLNTNYISSKIDDIRAEGDLIVKLEGFAANGAFYYQRMQEAKTNHMGGGLDLGYLISKKFEPVGRYSWTKPSDAHKHEIALGLNYYAMGQKLRSQIFAGVNLSGSEFENYLGGVQFQFSL